MGGGGYDGDTHKARAASKKAAGRDTFSHDEDIRKGRASGVHATLDPKLVNNKGDRAGKNIREALDSDEHPNATAIAVLFDVTGSMHSLPRILQEKLPALHGLLQRKGYVDDPQILFGAIGDAFSDQAPLQVGQFESDNTMDENLENIWLESGGGGGNHESYDLGAYFMARHTYIDCFEKRGKKGYLFLVGDERLYAEVDAAAVEKVIGDTLQENISTEDLFRELQEKWEVYFLFAAQGSYTPEATIAEDAGDVHTYGKAALGWRRVLGQNALILEDAGAVCETIALTLAMMEGGVAIEDGMEDIKKEIGDGKAADAAGKALATVGANAVAPASASGELPGLDEE